MEYLEGSDLSAWLAEHGRLPVEQAVDLLLQACEAIAEAHALGIVHRDLKPANLFVARLPGGVQSVKVLDFGISKMTGFSASGGESSATKTSALLGSPLYMSPEQMRSSKDVDARGDIWALGVILYELLAGAAPFLADTMPELVFKIVDGAPVPLSDVRPDVPPGLAALILRCVEKDRAKRFQTVGDLAGALAPFAPRKSRASIERIVQVMHAAGMSASAPASTSTVATRPELGRAARCLDCRRFRQDGRGWQARQARAARSRFADRRRCRGYHAHPPARSCERRRPCVRVARRGVGDRRSRAEHR